MATNSHRDTTGGSQNVIAATTRGLLEQKNDPDKVGSSDATKVKWKLQDVGFVQQTTKSVINARELNYPAREILITGQRDTTKTAIEEKSEVRPRQAIPTSDLVSSGGFKVGKKLVIRIHPSATAGSGGDNKSNKIDDSMPELVWDRFSLQSVAEDDQERYQIHETFEGEVLYLFGRRPRIWTFQGIVLNGERATVSDADIVRSLNASRVQISEQSVAKKRLELTGLRNMDFANELLRRYDQFYRGSKAVEQRAVTYIAYDDVLIESTLLGMVASRNSQIPSAVNVTFTVIVHDRVFFGQQPLRNHKTGQIIQDKNIADLIANQKLLFDDDKLKPSDILEAPLNGAGLRGAANAAQEDLKEKQNEVSEAKEQQDSARTALKESVDELASAEASVLTGKSAVASAQAALDSAEAVNPQVPANVQSARDTLKSAQVGLAQAEALKEKAEAKNLAAKAAVASADAEVADVVAAEGDAIQKAEALAEAEAKSRAIDDAKIDEFVNGSPTPETGLSADEVSRECLSAVSAAYNEAVAKEFSESSDPDAANAATKAVTWNINSCDDGKANFDIIVNGAPSNREKGT